MQDETATSAVGGAGVEQAGLPAHELSFWRRYWVQHVLPLGTSVLLHGLLIVLVVLTCKAVQSIVKTAEKEQIGRASCRERV